MVNKNIEIRLLLDQDEYRILKHHTNDLAVVPCGKDAVTRELTTGKLGNSNRIMVPKKLLERYNIDELDKKVPAHIFSLNGDKFLLIRMKRSKIGVPKFRMD